MIGIMKLRYRILLGYALIVFLFTVVAVAVYTSVSDLERLERKQDALNSARLIAGELEVQANALQSAARGLVVMKDDVLLDRFRQREATIKTLRASLEKAVQRGKEREILAKLNEVMNRWTEYYADLVGHVKDDRPEKALEVYKTRIGIKQSDELRSVITAFQDRQDELFNEAKSAAAHARDVVYRVLIGGMLLVIVLSTTVGLGTIRSANRLIGQTTNAISASSKEIAATVTQHEASSHRTGSHGERNECHG